MSKKIIAGNWKMNLDFKKSLLLANDFCKSFSSKKSKNEIVIFPDFSSIFLVSRIIKDSQIKFGAQDVAHKELGAYTGEVSLESLKQLNCKYILIGHSERRQYFGDNNLVSEKLFNVFKNSKITPILCVGENLSERKGGNLDKVLAKQLKDAFSKLKNKDLENKNIIIAYEPVWAIGTGLIAKPQDIDDAHQKIKNIIFKMFKNDKVKKIKILYGGSVDSNNFLDLQNLKNVDGLLIGGTSLKINDFLKIAYNF